MKFIVEVEDFYLQEDDIAESLKSYIKRDISSQIYANIKDQVTSIIDKIIKEEVAQQLAIRVDTLVKEISSNTKVKGRYTGNEDITISDYIQQQFNNTNVKQKTNDLIENATKKQALLLTEQFKQRYDMLFASQLVQRMNEIGMLKENVGQLLIKKEDKEV